jgi:hypothetical protein
MADVGDKAISIVAIGESEELSVGEPVGTCSRALVQAVKILIAVNIVKVNSNTRLLSTAHLHRQEHD